MTTVPTTEPERRTIGDILLDHGFVSEEALAAATAEQARTAQPLGQILVQAGAITRLELASALAEQWSDPSVSITPLPRAERGLASAPSRGDRGAEDEQYAGRLQEAVADLARRVQANEPYEDLERQITDLAERIDATLARTQVIEATVAALAESLEGVTEGVEEAFREIQTGTAELAQELVRIDGTFAELAGRPVTDPAVVAEISQRIEELAAHVDQTLAEAATEELQASVTELLARPLPDGTLGERVDALASRLDAIPARQELDELRGSLAALEARPAEDPALGARFEQVEAALGTHVSAEALAVLTARLDEFHTALDDLGSRPSDEAETRRRLEQVELTLGSHATADAVAELSERVGGLEHLGDAVTDLQARLTADGGTRDRVELLEAAVAALPSSEALAELEARLDTLAQLLATADDLGRLPAGDPAIDARLSLIEGALADRPAAAIAELEGRLGALDQRVASFSVEPDRSVSVEAVDALTDRLDAAEAAREETVRALTETQTRLAGELEALAGAPENPAVDELRQALEALRAEVAAAAIAMAPDPAILDQIGALTSRIDALASGPERDPELADRISELDTRLAADASAVAELQLGADAVAALRDRLEELAIAVASMQPADETPAATLGNRVEDLAASVAALQQVDAAPDLDDLRRDLDARIEEVVAKAAAAQTDDDPDSGAEHRALEARVDALARRLDETELPAGPPVVRSTIEPTGDSGGFEVEMERVLMAIERLSLHLAGHDRALAEVMQSRGTMQRLDELSDRIDDVAAGIGTGGGDGPPQQGDGNAEPRGDLRALARRVAETEAAAAADRAKLMDRLDKMASSIDWRLLRLEGAGEPDAD